MKRFVFITLLFAVFCIISLAQTSGIKGKVKTVKGKGLPGVTVSVIKDGLEIKQEETNEKGEFLIDGFDEGIYTFTFEKDGFDNASLKRIQVLKGQLRNLGDNLVLKISDNSIYVILRASVFDQDGLAIRGAKVEITKTSDNKRITTLYTNDAGEVSIRLPDQNATFRFTTYFQNAESVSGEITVEGAGMYSKSLTIKVSKPKKNESPQQP
jgi:Carboxypeptidase regulatory-like domain